MLLPSWDLHACLERLSPYHASDRSAVPSTGDGVSGDPWIALSEPTQPEPEPGWAAAIVIFEPSLITCYARMVCRPLSLVWCKGQGTA